MNDSAQVRQLIPRVLDQCPDCDVLINNASIFAPNRFEDTEEDFFDRHFTINFKTPFFLSRDFARLRQAGNIINLLDTKVRRTVTGYFVYTLSKKALFEFTRMAAKALAPRIRVNAVCPGLILPPAGEDEDYLERMKTHVPLQRAGDVEGVARAVRFLLENPFITGECLFVDGGEHLKA